MDDSSLTPLSIMRYNQTDAPLEQMETQIGLIFVNRKKFYIEPDQWLQLNNACIANKSIALIHQLNASVDRVFLTNDEDGFAQNRPLNTFRIQ